MKCVNCKKPTNSGYLWARMEGNYIRQVIDPESHQNIPIQQQYMKRIFVFCSQKCEEDFWLSKDRLKKSDFFKHRLISREEITAKFQKVLIESNDENEKALIHILRQSIGIEEETIQDTV